GLPEGLLRSAGSRTGAGGAALAGRRLRRPPGRLLRLPGPLRGHGHRARDHRGAPRPGGGDQAVPARRGGRDGAARPAAARRAHVHRRRLQLRRPRARRRAAPLGRAAGRLRRRRPAGLGRAERTGGGGRRRLPEDPRPDRGAVPAPLRAPHPVLQDRRRLPRLAQRAPAGVADGRRTALGPQPAAPGPGPGARRRLRGPDRPRTRRGAVARTAARARRPGGRNRRRGRAAMSIERFSLNQATVKRADLATVLDLAAAAGVPAVGLWRDRVAEIGLEEAASRLAGSGLRFSSLCRGGFLTDQGAAGEAWAENLRAIEEAAALAAAGAPGSAPVLVLVVGGLPPGDRDLRGARDRVRRMLHRLAPEARARGV